jgi:hypothetical protein
LQRRDVDGAIRLPRADDRRPGRSADGSRSRRLAAWAAGRCQLWCRTGPQGADPTTRSDELTQSAVAGPAAGRKIAGDASAERQRAGAGNRPLSWLPSRHSRSRRTLAGAAGERVREAAAARLDRLPQVQVATGKEEKDVPAVGRNEGWHALVAHIRRGGGPPAPGGGQGGGGQGQTPRADVSIHFFRMREGSDPGSDTCTADSMAAAPQRQP